MSEADLAFHAPSPCSLFSFCCIFSCFSSSSPATSLEPTYSNCTCCEPISSVLCYPILCVRLSSIVHRSSPFTGPCGCSSVRVSSVLAVYVPNLNTNTKVWRFSWRLSCHFSGKNCSSHSKEAKTSPTK